MYSAPVSRLPGAVAVLAPAIEISGTCGELALLRMDVR